MAEAPQPAPIEPFLLKDLPEWARNPLLLPIKFEPCQDLVVVFPDPAKEETRGGLMKATTTRGQIELKGTVIARGPGKNSDFTGDLIKIDWVTVGSRYTYSKFAGDDMLLDSDGNLSPWLGLLHDDHVLVKIMRASSILTRILE